LSTDLLLGSRGLATVSDPCFGLPFPSPYLNPCVQSLFRFTVSTVVLSHWDPNVVAHHRDWWWQNVCPWQGKLIRLWFVGASELTQSSLRAASEQCQSGLWERRCI